MGEGIGVWGIGTARQGNFWCFMQRPTSTTCICIRVIEVLDKVAIYPVSRTKAIGLGRTKETWRLGVGCCCCWVATCIMYIPTCIPVYLTRYVRWDKPLWDLGCNDDDWSLRWICGEYGSRSYMWYYCRRLASCRLATLVDSFARWWSKWYLLEVRVVYIRYIHYLGRR